MRKSKLKEQVKARFQRINNKNRNKILGISDKDKEIGRALKRAQPSVEEYVSSMADVPKIGFGLESEIKIRKVKRDEVFLDEHTSSQHDNESKYPAIYPAGWSLKENCED